MSLLFLYYKEDKVRKLLIILLIPLLLVSCGKNEDEKNVSTADSEKVSTNESEGKEDDDSKDDSDEDSKDEAKDKEDESENKNEPEFTQEELDKFQKMSLDYVKSLGSTINVNSEWYEDFNDDEKIEGIVFIDNSEYITDVLYLDMSGDKAVLIDETSITDLENDWPSDDAIYDSAGFTDLNGYDHTTPFVYRNPQPNSSAYIFFRISGTYLEPFINTDNLCDVGTTEAVDEDEDGYFDYYVLNRWGYDVFYYPITLKYKFDKELGTIYETGSIEIGEYPETPSDVVKEYLALFFIRDFNRDRFGEYTDVKNLDERLAELCEPELEPEYSYSRDLLSNLSIGAYDGTEVTEEIVADFANVTINPPEFNDNGDTPLIFELQIQEDGRWKITQISEPEEYWDDGN